METGPNLENFGPRFDVQARIGRGGFGDCYLAYDRNRGRIVAIKARAKRRSILKGDTKMAHECFQTMIRHEYNNLRQLEHPNIIEVYDLIDANNRTFMTMQLAEGGDLHCRLDKEVRFSEADAAAIVAQILEGISYMHWIGFMHRDLKLQNIVFESPLRNFRLKLIDFGLSCSTNEELKQDCGTLYYLAPEVLTAWQTQYSYGCEVDNWAVGVITYMLLSGCYPFNAPDESELRTQIIAGYYQFDLLEWEDVSNEARHFIRHLLMVDRRHRLTSREALRHPWITQKNYHAGAQKTPLTNDGIAKPNRIFQRWYFLTTCARVVRIFRNASAALTQRLQENAIKPD